MNCLIKSPIKLVKKARKNLGVTGRFSLSCVGIFVGRNTAKISPE